MTDLSMNREAAAIDILLATYNGEVFLDEQLESIAAQWREILGDRKGRSSTVIATHLSRMKNALSKPQGNHDGRTL